jgi:hypothetical protein
MPDEQRVHSFMQAVYDTREQEHGWAHAANIMAHMGLKMSGIVDSAHNPTTPHDKIYRHLARYCEKERGYIESVDRYASVRITKRGIQYVESSFTRL